MKTARIKAAIQPQPVQAFAAERLDQRAPSRLSPAGGSGASVSPGSAPAGGAPGR